jgi:hypothetical protein
MTLRDQFERFRAPGEAEAGERAWGAVSAAFDEERRERSGAPHSESLAARLARRFGRARSSGRGGARRALALAAAGAAAIAVVLTPAGAAVADWIQDVVEPEPRPAGPPALRLAGGGRLLVDTPAGSWTVAHDGARRLLGDYEGASWSPQGLFVVAHAGRDLTALEPGGRVRWERTAPAPVAGARWAPSGFRIAYLSGGALRVVAGDGTADRLLVPAAGPALPAWRPGARHVLAYADRSGRVVVADADFRDRLWRSARGEPALELAWSGDGRRLVARGRTSLRTFSRSGRLLRTVTFPALEPTPQPARSAQAPGGGAPSTAATAGLVAFAPGGHELALVRRQPGTATREVVLLTDEPDPGSPRRLFAAPGLGGVAWSPDGRWVLVSWDANDQWVFVSADGSREVRTAGRIAERFDPGNGRGPQRPSLAGWCCPP